MRLTWTASMAPWTASIWAVVTDLRVTLALRRLKADEEAEGDMEAARLPTRERERLEGRVAKPRAAWGRHTTATMQAAASCDLFITIIFALGRRRELVSAQT